MISEYLQAAMNRARYEMIEDEEPFYGEIPECRGVWATGKSLEECRRELLSALESWLLFSLDKGIPTPLLDGLTLSAPDVGEAEATNS